MSKPEPKPEPIAESKPEPIAESKPEPKAGPKAGPKARVIQFGKLVLCITVCEGAGLLGAVATSPAIPTWYAALKKPSFSPPNYLFAPVWTILFALMGVALFLVWEKGFDRADVRAAMGVFGVQLVLNVLWSFLFFGGQSPAAGLIEIIVLWIAIVATIVAFRRVSAPAAILLVPYILWVSFAAVLNFAIWLLNA